MGLKVNVSEQENKSGGDYVPLPSGNYNCIITSVESKTSASQDNFGKPMLYFYFTIQDGVYAERVMGVNACLWTGALYTIIGLLKALDMYDGNKDGDDLDIPTAPEAYIGKPVRVRRGLNKKAKEKNPEDDPTSWIEVRGFSKPELAEASSSGTSGKPSSSLLP